MSDSKKLLSVLNKKSSAGIPFWFMRQAGRYLPEYKQLRSTTSGFLDFCYNPQKAAEATLQPIKRFGMDAAIIFSDILVIPDALGVKVVFQEGVGPVLEPVQNQSSLEKLSFNKEKLSPVYEALRITKSAISRETTLIGFAGAPWTLACYTVQGKADRDFASVRQMALRDPVFFSSLINLLTESVITHTKNQIEAGAEVIQIFDSWSGVLSEDEFLRWVIEPTTKIVAALKSAYPHVPVIGFPRLAGVKYFEYAKQTKVDAVSVDPTLPLEWISEELQSVCVVQGNLDSLLLAENKDAAVAQTKKIISAFKNKPFVFNLGHGILPHTPLENVQAVCDVIKNSS